MKRRDAEKIRDLPQIILLESSQTVYSHRFQAPPANISIHLEKVRYRSKYFGVGILTICEIIFMIINSFLA